jgi:MinD superfamily P-loop ATPase
MTTNINTNTEKSMTTNISADAEKNMNTNTEKNMKTQEHIVAVVEPTRDGEATLDIANEVVNRGGRATIVVLVTRKTMSDIRAFAESENLTVPDASEIYFERLAETYSSRVGSPDASAVVTESASSGRTVFETAASVRPTTIVMPQRLANRRGWRSSVARSQVPVLIAPSTAAA